MYVTMLLEDENLPSVAEMAETGVRNRYITVHPYFVTATSRSTKALLLRKNR